MSSGVEFDEDSFGYGAKRFPSSKIGGVGAGLPGNYSANSSAENQPAMVRWLMRKGIVKSPNAAQAILIAIVVINIIITFIVVKYFL